MRYLLLPVTLLAQPLLAELLLRGIIFSFLWFFIESGIIIYFLFIEIYVYVTTLILIGISFFIFGSIDKFYKNSIKILYVHTFSWILGGSYFFYDLYRKNLTDIINPFYYWDFNWLKTIIGYPQYFILLIGGLIFPIIYFYQKKR